MLKSLPLLAFIFFLQVVSSSAQMFELSTTREENGRYTYSFSEGFYPVAFGFSYGSGSISFHVPDATNITAPEGWIINQTASGFEVTYNGVFEVYPLGYETIDISFFSALSISEIGTSSSDYTGIVSGSLVLQNGFSQGYQRPDGSFVTSPAGFQNFYFDMPAYEGEQLTAADLMTLFGLTVEEIKPVAANVQLTGNTIDIEIGNVIEGATYILQFNETLDEDKWINVRTFTHAELSNEGEISHAKQGLSGFFRITML